jgi:hypothetical protein
LRVAIALGLSCVLGGVALADDPPEDGDGISGSDVDVSHDTGYIGQEVVRLEIDDCKALDPSVTQDQLRIEASEHYQRGETLYLQGDYEGTVQELVAAYCLLPSYRMLKSIGQAYERSLEYEKAIAYLNRWLAAVPNDAKKASSCDVDPQEDKETVRRRIKVLEALPSRVFVGTTPSGAQVTISNETGVKARASSGEQIQITGGRYDMLVEKDGYIAYKQAIDVRIGKPYTFFVPLVVEKGRLSIQVTPSDARLYVDDRYVGTGRFDEDLAGNTYTISAEAPGHVRATRKVQVIQKRTQRELIDLEEIPQTGRRQLIIAAGAGAAYAGGALLFGVNNDGKIFGPGAFAVGGAGLAGAYFGLRDDLPLATSNLTITSSIAGGALGYYAANVFSGKDEVRFPVSGASMLAGAALGYIASERFDATVGDVALYNSALLWGSTTGVLLARSFDPPRSINAGLVLSGMAIGGVGGAMLTRYFDISRQHSVLIDLGGLAGVVGGLATQSLAYNSSRTDNERVANFALGGMAIGLVTAGILSRNVDEPNVLSKVSPTLGTATDAGGKATATYGLGGAW